MHENSTNLHYLSPLLQELVEKFYIPQLTKLQICQHGIWNIVSNVETSTELQQYQRTNQKIIVKEEYTGESGINEPKKVAIKQSCLINNGNNPLVKLSMQEKKVQSKNKTRISSKKDF